MTITTVIRHVRHRADARARLLEGGFGTVEDEDDDIR